MVAVFINGKVWIIKSKWYQGSDAENLLSFKILIPSTIHPKLSIRISVWVRHLENRVLNISSTIFLQSIISSISCDSKCVSKLKWNACFLNLIKMAKSKIQSV